MPQIIPIKELKDTAKISDMCHSTSEPIFVTKNGYGDMVILSMESYENLQRRIRLYSELAVSETEIAEGKSRDARAALAESRSLKHRLYSFYVDSTLTTYAEKSL